MLLVGILRHHITVLITGAPKKPQLKAVRERYGWHKQHCIMYVATHHPLMQPSQQSVDERITAPSFPKCDSTTCLCKSQSIPYRSIRSRKISQKSKCTKGGCPCAKSNDRPRDDGRHDGRHEEASNQHGSSDAYYGMDQFLLSRLRCQ
jgi:hypothetical protein